MNSSQLSNIGVTTCFHAGADVANIPSTSLSTNQTAVKGVLQRFFSIQGFLKKIRIFVCISFTNTLFVLSFNLIQQFN